MNTFLKYFIILSIIILSLKSTDSFGQKPGIGIKAGVALSNIKVDDESNDPNIKRLTKAGLLFGIFYNVPMGDKFIFRPEVDLVEKGFIEEYDLYSYPETFTYLDFPLHILYKIKSSKSHFLLGAGPVIGVSIDNRYSYYSTKTDFSINAMAGYEIEIGFSINVNCTYGLTNLNYEDQTDHNFSNRYVGITVGYSF